MNDLFARFSNLSYEIFGVILPGMVLSLFLLLWWAAIGDFATTLAIPIFSIEQLKTMLDSLTFAAGMGAAIPIITAWYFFGHLVLWVTRSGAKVDSENSSAGKRVYGCLKFRVPKPLGNFDESLTELYKVVCREFSGDDVSVEWRQFFPLAKCFISQRLTTSLVNTYQNKYTFHRSIVGASSLLFWISIITLPALFYSCDELILTDYIYVVLLVLISILFVWGFSSSYMFHWKSFGNALVTESYSLIRNPKKVDDVG